MLSRIIEHQQRPEALIDLQGTMDHASKSVKTVLEKALEGREVSVLDGELLFGTEGADLAALISTADYLRKKRVGDSVTFVVNRNINFTNVCYMGCRFCGFAKREDNPDAYLLTIDEVVRRADEAWRRGATEVCIQGGLHPKISGAHYKNTIASIKSALPEMHIHAFSPFEIWYGSHKSGRSTVDFLRELKDHGLGSIPGTAAEILDTEVRNRLTRNKLSTEAWIDIVTAAHELGIRSTATIMYGHVDGPRHWSAHLDLLRSIQKQTGGFTEFVPLGFVHTDSPLFLEGTDVRPGPTRVENIRMHAVARIMLDGQIDNIQVSWVKLGPRVAEEILKCGANDMGGTLMNESITRAAGGKHGQEITSFELVKMIRGIDRMPVRRDTLYCHKEAFIDHDPVELAPLVGPQDIDPVERALPVDAQAIA